MIADITILVSSWFTMGQVRAHVRSIAPMSLRVLTGGVVI